MKLLNFFIMLAAIILVAHPSHAQPAALTAPLLATSSGELDRIILYDLNGGQRVLRFDARLHYAWGFSPDGCRVILTLGERGGVSRLYSARLDGSDLRPLVEFADLPANDWSVWEPMVNPADGRIAFTLFRRRKTDLPPPLSDDEKARLAEIVDAER